MYDVSFCVKCPRAVLLQEFNEPSTTVLRKVFSTCIAFAKYVEWKEPDVAAAEQRVYTLLEENRENQERIEVLRREYDMACNDQEDKELVRGHSGVSLNALHKHAPSVEQPCQERCSFQRIVVLHCLKSRQGRLSTSAVSCMP